MEPTGDELCCWYGRSPCEWELCEEELWLTGGRLQGKLRLRKHRNRVLRQTLGRLYLYQKYGNLSGRIPACIARKLKQYWPNSPRKVSKCYVFILLKVLASQLV
eukprot:jgi/Phyca11/127958/e_gw1.73.198.1